MGITGDNTVLLGTNSSGTLVPVLVDAGGAIQVDVEAGDINIGNVDVASTVHPTGLSTIASGELQGSATELQCPNVACKYVRFKAVLSNAGNVYVGVDNVTLPDGTTDVTTGLELTPGDDTGWIPASNLNIFWRICDNATDDLTYLAIT